MPVQPLHLVPGSISLATPTQALPTHHPYHFLGSPPTTAPAVTLSSDVSTVAWWLGSSQLSNTKTSFPLWKKLVEQLGETWNRRCAQDEACKCHACASCLSSFTKHRCSQGQSSGLIIDTPASFTTPGLGAQKGDRTRYGIARHAMEILKGTHSVILRLILIGTQTTRPDSFPPLHQSTSSW
jgi:polyribonucleotide 5'-hydroxyl-kinase